MASFQKQIGGIALIAAAFAIGLVIGLFTERASNDQGAHGGSSTPFLTQSFTRRPVGTKGPVHSPTKSPTTVPRQPSSTFSSTSPPSKPSICNAKVTPLLLISVDGFRWDYFNRGFNPNLTKFAAHGVRAEYMQPSFPTRTFPNHYTLVTGLYPAYHGIVANYIYDPVLQDTFSIGGKTSTQSKWWKGEPIWVTARKNDLKSASFFWVGSEAEVNGYRPNYWYRYNGSITYMDRVKQFFDWIEMPEDKRPTMITMYFDEPDHMGHIYGPDSDEVNAEIKRVDDTIGAILYGLKDRGLQDCINIIVTSDHGMRKTCCDRIVYLDKYIDIKENYVVNYGPFGSIRVKDNVTQVVEQLKCHSKHLRVYKKKELPVRLHYHENIRIPDVVLLPNNNWLVRKSYDPRYTFCDGANHGWDNLDRDMRTIFLAAGPAFKSGMIIKPFSNIEVYNLLATLLKIKPAKNNGTMGRLNSILKNPAPIMKQPVGQAGNVCRMPQDAAVYKERTSCSACVCPFCSNDTEANLNVWNKALEMTSLEEKQSKNRNFPWGVPTYRKPMDTCTLYQNHYITGYSNAYRVPLYVGYYLTDTEVLMHLTRKDCFRRDPRLDATTQSSNCSNYYHSDFDRGHLAPNGDMNFNLEAQANSYLLSNIAPQYPKFNRGLWYHLEDLTRKWSTLYGGLHVTSGSIVMADSTMVWKDSSYWLNGDIGSVVIPTHFYKILAKCQDTDKMACNGSAAANFPCNGKIDVLAFILPHLDETTPQCQIRNTYLFEHVASVRDIEKLTGINFFPNLSQELQDNIEIDVTTELWPTY